jgi:hypothetical protein
VDVGSVGHQPCPEQFAEDVAVTLVEVGRPGNTVMTTAASTGRPVAEAIR